MGLDLYVRKYGKIKTNKKGQYYWTVTELLRLRNTWEYLDLLELENCKTEEYDGEVLWDEALHIQNETERNYVLDELKNAKIKRNDYYRVHAWW